jgi:flagellar biosynthetic protein FlhB
VENRIVAQTLYRTVEIGSEIPPRLYRAVAEILTYVYKLKGKI